jgi:hypothetical protein
MKWRLATLTLFLLLWAGSACAQGCAMCYSSARGATKDGQRAISRGVLVLLIPPVGFMTLGFGMAMRYSKKRDQDLVQDGDQDGFEDNDQDHDRNRDRNDGRIDGRIDGREG